MFRVIFLLLAAQTFGIKLKCHKNAQSCYLKDTWIPQNEILETAANLTDLTLINCSTSRIPAMLFVYSPDINSLSIYESGSMELTQCKYKRENFVCLHLFIKISSIYILLLQRTSKMPQNLHI